MNNPYLYIGALDLSPYIVSVDSPAIALRGLSLELEREIYFMIIDNKNFNSIGYVQLEKGRIAVASCIGCGNLESAQYSAQGKLGLTLVHTAKQCSYFVWLRNIDSEWWTKSNPNPKRWRKEKQARLL